MQLKNLTGALALASCALLDVEAQAETDRDWKFDTAILYYGESDDRVQVVEGIFAAQKEVYDDAFLNLKVTVDTLTGASATGAVAQPTVQTYTRPSGKGSYQVAPGETPLDDTFKDTRIQLNGQWSQPWGENMKISGGVHFSKEYDYLSLGLNGNIARDFNDKNTTLSAGFAYSHDTISPEGGRPIPYASMVVAGTGNGKRSSRQDDEDDAFDNTEHLTTRQKGDGTKDTADLLFGVTQVINRRTIMQFNYSFSTNDGYMTDPFKMLSVVNGGGLTQDLLFEKRPDKRTKHSFYWQTKYHFDSAVADVSYRYMTDDWDVKSHTADTRLRFTFDDDSYLEPHFRYYQQSGADFYKPYLVEGEMLPGYASADYRIGGFDAITVGIKYGIPLDSGNELAFRLEYYKQDPSNKGFIKPGVLSNYNLSPDLSAVILQVSYSF
jgi:hypothetical protein